jgi:TonB family protein
MGASDKTVYGQLEQEQLDNQHAGPATNACAVKHNDPICIDEQSRPCAQQAGQPKVIEPASNMANDKLTKSEMEPEGVVAPAGSDPLLDALMGKAFEEKSIFADLWEGIHDIFFPPKLPPLELTSKPIPVIDPMAVKPNPWAIGISTTVNVAILLIVLFFVGRKIIQQVTKPNLTATEVDVSEFKGLKQDTRAGGGGGGGSHDIVDASKGKLPKLEKNPATPPQIPVVDKPKLEMESAINVQKELQLPDNPLLPNIGVKNSANVRLASNGEGSGGGMGTGSGGGLGSGRGNGYGPGEGGNAGGGTYQLGGGDSPPVLIYSVDPEFSDEARRAKYQGICLISLIVDAQGNPVNPHVIRALGMGLDEKALEAVRKYKFRPAMKGRKTPVPVPITIEVNFRLY